MKYQNLLLYPKHWQLFLLYLVLIFAGVFTRGTDPYHPGSVVSTACYLIMIFLYLTWLLSIGVAMYNSLPLSHQKKGTAFFKFSYVCLIIPVVFTIYYVDKISEEGNMHQYDPTPLFIMAPVIIFMVWSLLYMLVFTAKMLAKIKNRDKPDPGQVFLWFLALSYFPIGVWFVQPTAERQLQQVKEI